MGKRIQKLYCFADETGQDAGSDFFIVVVVIIVGGDLEKLRSDLIFLERLSKVGNKKWKKLRSPEREKILELVINRGKIKDKIYYGFYHKPVPFFVALVETLRKAICLAAPKAYGSIIYVDGIDRQKSSELTKILRIYGVKTSLVRSVRDESDPFIRLADRWAGCVRAGLEGQALSKILFHHAINKGYLTEV